MRSIEPALQPAATHMIESHMAKGNLCQFNKLVGLLQATKTCIHVQNRHLKDLEILHGGGWAGMCLAA